MTTQNQELAKSSFKQHALNKLNALKQEVSQLQRQLISAYPNGLPQDFNPFNQALIDVINAAVLDPTQDIVAQLNTFSEKQQNLETVINNLANLSAYKDISQNILTTVKQRLNQIKSATQEIAAHQKMFQHADQLESRRELEYIVGQAAESYYDSTEKLKTNYLVDLPADLLVTASKNPNLIIPKKLTAMRPRIQALHDATQDPGAKAALKALYESLTPGKDNWPIDLEKHLQAVKNSARGDAKINLITVEIDMALGRSKQLNQLTFLYEQTKDKPETLFDANGKLISSTTVNQRIQEQGNKVNTPFHEGKLTAAQVGQAKLKTQANQLRWLIANLDLSKTDLKVLRDSHDNNAKGPITKLVELLEKDANKIGQNETVTEDFLRYIDECEKIIGRQNNTGNVQDNTGNVLAIQSELKQLRSSYKLCQNSIEFGQGSLAATLAGKSSEANIVKGNGELITNPRKTTHDNFPKKINERLANGQLSPMRAAKLIAGHQQAALQQASRQITGYPAVTPPIQNLGSIKKQLGQLTTELAQKNPQTQRELTDWAQQINQAADSIEQDIQLLRTTNPEVAEDLAQAFNLINEQIAPQLKTAAQLVTDSVQFEQLCALETASGIAAPKLIDPRFGFHSLTEQQRIDYTREVNRALQTGKVSISLQARKKLPNYENNLNTQRNRPEFKHAKATLARALPEQINAAIENLQKTVLDPAVTAESLQQAIAQLEKELAKLDPVLADHDPLIQIIVKLKQQQKLLASDKTVEHKVDLVKFGRDYAKRLAVGLEQFKQEQPFQVNPAIQRYFEEIKNELNQPPINLSEVSACINETEAELAKIQPKLPKDHPVFQLLNGLKDAHQLWSNHQAYAQQIESLRLQGEECQLVQPNGTLELSKIQPVNRKDALVNESQAIASGEKTSTRDYYRKRLELHNSQVKQLVENLPNKQTRTAFYAQLDNISQDIAANDFSKIGTYFESLGNLQLGATSDAHLITANLTSYKQAITNYQQHRQITQDNLWQRFVNPEYYTPQYKPAYVNPNTDAIEDQPTGQNRVIDWALPQSVNIDDAAIKKINSQLRNQPEKMANLGAQVVHAEIDTLDEALQELKFPATKLKELNKKLQQLQKNAAGNQTEITAIQNQITSLKQQQTETESLTKSVEQLRNEAKAFPKDGEKLKHRIDDVKKLQKETVLQAHTNTLLDQAIAGIEQGQKLHERGDKFVKVRELGASISRPTDEIENAPVVQLGAQNEIKLVLDTSRQLAETAQAMNEEIHREITSLCDYADRQLQMQGKKLLAVADKIKPAPGDENSEKTAQAFKQAIEDFVADCIEHKSDNFEQRVTKLNNFIKTAEKDKVEFDKKEFERLMGGIQSALVLYHHHQQIQASLTFMERAGETIKLIDEKTGEIKPMFRNLDQLKQTIDKISGVYQQRFKVEKKEGKDKESSYYVTYDTSPESARTLIDMLAKDSDFTDTNDFVITSGMFSDARCLAAASEALAVEHSMGRTMQLEFKRFWYGGKQSDVQNDLNEIFALRKEIMQSDNYDKNTVYAEIYKKLFEPGRRQGSAATFLKTLSITDRKRILDKLDKPTKEEGNAKQLTTFVSAFDNKELAQLISRSEDPGKTYAKIMDGCDSKRASGLLQHLHNDKTLNNELFKQIMINDISDDHVQMLLELSKSKNPFKRNETTKAGHCLFPNEIDQTYINWINLLSPKQQQAIVQDPRFKPEQLKFMFFSDQISDQTRRNIYSNLTYDQQRTLWQSANETQLSNLLQLAEQERLSLIGRENKETTPDTGKITQLNKLQHYWVKHILEFNPEFSKKLTKETIEQLPVRTLEKIPANIIVHLNDDIVKTIANKLATQEPEPQKLLSNGHSWMGLRPTHSNYVELAEFFPEPKLSRSLKVLLDALIDNHKSDLAKQVADNLPADSPQKGEAKKHVEAASKQPENPQLN